MRSDHTHFMRLTMLKYLVQVLLSLICNKNLLTYFIDGNCDDFGIDTYVHAEDLMLAMLS